MSTPPLSASSSAQLSPFVLEPIVVERIWGTQSLAPWHRDPEDGKLIGEVWLTAETCRVESGDAPGDTLAAVTRQQPSALGDAQEHGFPLLIKLLFPREKLSVQVHPNDAEAQLLGMPRGKTECWYVLSAEPGAAVAVGFQEELTPRDVRTAIEDGSLESKLRMIPVSAGDMIFVDAGTVHAIGPGMVVLETQQYSDTTYRLWDYGRPRELHIEAGTAVTRTSTAAGPVTPEVMAGWTRLVSCRYFAVDRFELAGSTAHKLGGEDHLQILIALAEGCSVSDGQQEYALPKGKAVVIPVSSVGYQLQAVGAGEVIRVLQP